MTIILHALLSIIIAIGLVALVVFCAWVTYMVLKDDEDEYGSKR